MSVVIGRMAKFKTPVGGFIGSIAIKAYHIIVRNQYSISN
jgi:hypothetical protein